MYSTNVPAGAKAWRSLPEPEGGPSGEQHGFRLGLGLFKQPEKGVVLHTDLPEDLAAVPTTHHELQGVLAVALLSQINTC